MKLVLNIKEPDSKSSGHTHHANLNDQPGNKSVNHTEGHGPKKKSEIHDVNGTLFPGFRFRAWNAFEDKKEKERSQKKENKGVTKKAVAQLDPTRGGKVFLDRERPNIPNSPPIQVSIGGVVHGMFPFPMMIRSENT